VTLPGSVRWFVAVAVTFGLQFCCCNLETMFRVCLSCGDHSVAASADHGHHHHDLASEHAGHAHATGPEDRHEVPPSREHQHDGDCTCGSHEVAKSLPEKPRLELPALSLIAVLPEPEFDDPGFTSISCRWTPTESVFRPPTSLLRQHCALTI